MTFHWIIMWKWLEAALGWGEWVHSVKSPGRYFSVESLTIAFRDYQTSAVSSDFHYIAESLITKYYVLRGQCGKVIMLLEIPFWVSLTFFHWKIKLFTILILEEISHCLVNNYQCINFGVNLVLSCQNSNSLIETRVSLAASGIGHITMTMTISMSMILIVSMSITISMSMSISTGTTGTTKVKVGPEADVIFTVIVIMILILIVILVI